MDDVSRALLYAQMHPAPRMPKLDDARPWRVVEVVTDADNYADHCPANRAPLVRERGNGRFPVPYSINAKPWMMWLAADLAASAPPGVTYEAEPVDRHAVAADPARWMPGGPPPTFPCPDRIARDDGEHWPILGAIRAPTAPGDSPHRWVVIAQDPDEQRGPLCYVVGDLLAGDESGIYHLRNEQPGVDYATATVMLAQSCLGTRLI